MSLEKRLQTSLDQEQTKLETRLEKSLADKKRELEKQLSKLERSYKNDVESEIQHRVNAELHKVAKANRFEHNFGFEKELNDLFVTNLPEIIQTKYVQKVLKTFFSAIKGADKVVIGGTESETLVQIAQTFGCKATTEKSAKLGYIHAHFSDHTLELDLHELMKTIQKKTLSVILA